MADASYAAYFYGGDVSLLSNQPFFSITAACGGLAYAKAAAADYLVAHKRPKTKARRDRASVGEVSGRTELYGCAAFNLRRRRQLIPNKPSENGTRPAPTIGPGTGDGVAL
jgi:hypothetical protein